MTSDVSSVEVFKRAVAEPDRQRLQSVLYVPYNDTAWQLLPLELGLGPDLLAAA
ncbi:hypothetical protein [Streptomyces fradiae]|uniref:hypothetical protein n=1 Tax=Streptomyces fradiae TaxID=1906 RepID=UPI002942AA96|nr:hypothetical protein [Streptomyces fradiae]WOI62041.1 hypothetical protein RYQ63_20245 [Streptomyces fradiae]